MLDIPRPYKQTIIISVILVTLGSCVKKFQCDAIESDNPLMSISMFPEHNETYSFVSLRDTIVLKMLFVETSPSYINECNPLHPLDLCGCESFYRELYENDAIQVMNEIWYHSEPDEPRSYSYDYRYKGISGYMEFSHDDLQGQIDALLQERVIINNTSFNNVLEIVEYHDNRAYALRIVIKPNVGMVAFAIDDDLYTLID